jgi:hypothetical protein
MANVFISVYTSVRDALTKFEGLLVTALALQTIVVNFVGTTLPAEQKLVSDIFGIAAVVVAVIKVVLSNNAAAKRS